MPMGATDSVANPASSGSPLKIHKISEGVYGRICQECDTPCCLYFPCTDKELTPTAACHENLWDGEPVGHVTQGRMTADTIKATSSSSSVKTLPANAKTAGGKFYP